MFPPLRMDSLFPVNRRQNTDTPESLYDRFSQLVPHDINPNLINAISAHQVPINRYAKPFTTNNLVSTGINGANTDMNTVATQNSVSPLDMAKLDQKNRELTSKDTKNENDLKFKQSKQEEDNKVRTSRAAVYKFKAENPGMKFDYSGPNVIVSDPISGKSHDTGIPTGHLSDTDKINLNSTDRINEIGARGNESRNTNTLSNAERGSNRLNEIAATGEQNRKTNKEKSVSETQRNQGYLNKANQLVNSNPQYKDYITIHTNQDGKPVGFTINPPKNGMGSDDPTYHEVNSKIYGNSSNDVTIPSDDRNKSDKSKTKDTTKTDTKADPLGIR